MLSLLLALVAVFAAPRTTYTLLPDLPYADTHERQVLDVFLPQTEAETLPVLLLIHGGGYVFGDKAILHPVADYFAEHGYAVVVPNYRLAVPYPAPLEDIFCAYAWVYAHANEYGFNPEQIFVLGESAGGNAAAMLAAVDEPTRYLTRCPQSLPASAAPAALITYYMYSDLATCDGNCGLVVAASEVYLGMTLEGLDAAARQAAWGDASPLVWINGSEPPALLIHGLQDTVVPPSETAAFAAALQAAGVSVQTLYLPEASHGFVEKFELPGSLVALAVVHRYLQMFTGM